MKNDISVDIDTIYGNYYDKYSSKNFINRLLIKKFIGSLREVIKELDYSNVLDVGCGEGYITNVIYQQKRCDIVAIDLGKEQINRARKEYKDIKFINCSIYKLPFRNNSFDVVTAIEILEHLNNPEDALKEIKRVTREWVIFSVPDEPLWRILNCLSFRYLKNMGNTPGHVNHWTVRQFNNLVAKYFKVIKVLKPLPWIIVLARK